MDLEAEYNNRARVPDSAAIIGTWARDAAAFRADWSRSTLDIPYGEGPRERFDLFEAEVPGPVAMFIHGGYWQALDKSFGSHWARGLAMRGVTVAVPSYDLCPNVPLRRIVEQMRAACITLHRRTERRLLVVGHSAGGHLAAMLMATDWAAIDPSLPPRLVGAALPVSGVFELEPVMGTSVGRGLNLTPEEARALSPRWMRPAIGELHAVVGGAESAEFIRQTIDFAAAWRGSAEEIPDANHFTVLEPFPDPAHALVSFAADMAGRLAPG
ncbi:alpha/beta hydrolase [Roseomonas sp. HJA6]|uniref:Alpha/beta hydrolase n=1 Tax=Roseomonas alba TaxID=2846776 RepID=A0ABS7A4Z1_9PROT|nr:alpha/beta hydrolase [Neoroseomonas alba]MBW6397326.1 alpha/beta hydrolase [Neoroseomonas alba]